MEPRAGTDCTTRFDSLDEFRQSNPEFEAHSYYLQNAYGSIFKSPELGRYELLHALPQPVPVDSLPGDIRNLLGWSKRDASTAGAYPLSR